MNRVGVFSQFVIDTGLKSPALTKTDNSNLYFQNSIVLARFVLFLSGIPKMPNAILHSAFFSCR